MRRNFSIYGSSPTASLRIARFHHYYPHIDVAIHTSHTREIIEMLYEHYVQLGFVVGPLFHLEISPLLHIKEPLMMVARP